MKNGFKTMSSIIYKSLVPGEKLKRGTHRRIVTSAKNNFILDIKSKKIPTSPRRHPEII
jgi:hypothetical protein